MDDNRVRDVADHALAVWEVAGDDFLERTGCTTVISRRDCVRSSGSIFLGENLLFNTSVQIPATDWQDHYKHAADQRQSLLSR